MDRLAENFTVVLPDLPGYGSSTRTLDQRDPFRDAANAVAGLLDGLGIARSHVAGYSYGGGTALRMAVDHRARVNRMVLVAPGGIGITRSLSARGLNQLFNYYSGKGPSRERMAMIVRDYLVANGACVPDEVIDAKYLASIDPESLANPPFQRPSGRGALGTLWRIDITRDKRLKDCDVPTLVLWGQCDVVCAVSGGDRLVRKMPHCDLHLVSGVGHWVQYEAADLFHHVASAFLGAEKALAGDESAARVS